MKASPSTIDELLDRAEALAGLTLGELAQSENIRVPNDFKREKGWSCQRLYWQNLAGLLSPLQRQEPARFCQYRR